jgi:hypothetical protein
VGTIIVDEDGVYDPWHRNDRLLLGMKGTMSELELRDEGRSKSGEGPFRQRPRTRMALAATRSASLVALVDFDE